MKNRTLAVLIILGLLLVSVAPLAAQDATECEDGFRLFDHKVMLNAPTCIPETPERVVVIGFTNVVPMVRAGVNVVGTNQPEVSLNNYPEWEKFCSGSCNCTCLMSYQFLAANLNDKIVVETVTITTQTDKTSFKVLLTNTTRFQPSTLLWRSCSHIKGEQRWR